MRVTVIACVLCLFIGIVIGRTSGEATAGAQAIGGGASFWDGDVYTASEDGRTLYVWAINHDKIHDRESVPTCVRIVTAGE